MTTENNFKKGDTVVLKSGGPSMTIDAFTWNNAKDAFNTDVVECVWFDGLNLKREIFNISSLNPE